MNLIKTCSVILFSSFLFSTTFGQSSQNSSSEPLSGSYKVGGMKYDFANLNEAIDTWTKVGMDRDVTFLVKENQELIKGLIIGKTTNPKGYFLSIEGVKSRNKIEISSRGTSTIILDNSSNIYIKNLHLSGNLTNKNLIQFNGENKEVKIQSCSFSGVEEWPIIESKNGGLNKITFKNNEFEGGDVALQLMSPGQMSSMHIDVKGNQFINQKLTSIFLSNTSFTNIEENTFFNLDSESNYFGIKCQKLAGICSIKKNTLEINTGTGIQIHGIHTGRENKLDIFNNLITLDGNSSDPYIIGLELMECQETNIFFNTIVLRENSSKMGTALLSKEESTIPMIKNNIFVNLGDGPVAKMTHKSLIYDFSNNIIFGAGETKIQVDHLDIETIEDLNQEYPLIKDIFFEDPGFNLLEYKISQPELFSKGTPIDDIKFDIERLNRGIGNPNIGAFEATAQIRNNNMSDEEFGSINLFPNPAEGHIFIDSDKLKEVPTGYMLLDINGKMVKRVNADLSGKTRIDLDGLSPSTYIVSVEGVGNISEKFIKKSSTGRLNFDSLATETKTPKKDKSKDKNVIPPKPAESNGSSLDMDKFGFDKLEDKNTDKPETGSQSPSWEKGKKGPSSSRVKGNKKKEPKSNNSQFQDSPKKEEPKEKDSKGDFFKNLNDF